MYFIQVGAFKKQQNAAQLSVKLGGITACQVGVIMENGFYKVRFGGFTTKSALNTCRDVIIKSGLFTAEQIHVILPAKKVKEVKAIPPVTPAKVTIHPDTVKKISKGKKLYFVQLGAYTDQRNAARIVVNSTHTIPYKLEIIHHDQFYKVRFGGFTTSKEAEECIKLIDQKGMVSKENLIIVSVEISPEVTAEPTTK